MNEQQLLAIKKLEQVTEYFKRNYEKGYELFKPEFDISSNIIAKIKAKATIGEKELEEIVDKYNQINELEHYNGSGWMDFKIRLEFFFRVFDYECKFDLETDRLSIKRRNIA